MSNKKVQRTQERQQTVMLDAINEASMNNIEEYKFEKLVRTGVIVREEAA